MTWITAQEALDWINVGYSVFNENGTYSKINGKITIRYWDGGAASPIYNPPYNDWVFEDDNDFLKSQGRFIKKK